jgi:hypothetical protein
VYVSLRHERICTRRRHHLDVFLIDDLFVGWFLISIVLKKEILKSFKFSCNNYFFLKEKLTTINKIRVIVYLRGRLLILTLLLFLILIISLIIHSHISWLVSRSLVLLAPPVGSFDSAYNNTPQAHQEDREKSNSRED